MPRKIKEPQMQKLMAHLKAMGWTMHIPLVEGQLGIPGAIIGTHVFVDVVKEMLVESSQEENDFLPKEKKD